MSARTIVEAFRRTVASAPDRVAFQTIDGAVALTWAELARRVNALAGGLAKLGVQRGDTVALMMSNRPEFHLCDLAVMTLGATPFSIYQTLSPEQIAYVVGDAGARVLIVERGFLTAIDQARKTLPLVEHVIVLDGDGGTTTLAAVEGSNPDFDADAAGDAVGPDDILTLIYTSGTTGPPKGVQLRHRSLIASSQALQTMVQFPEGARVISWLPAAHIAERAAHHYLPIVFGMTVTCCPNAKEVVSLLPQVRPSWFFAVPRIWEKIKGGLEARLAALPDEEQKKRAQAALAAAVQKVQLEQAGKPVPPALAEQVAAADAALFGMLRTMLGLDQAVAVNVGAAPTPRDVLEFFHAIGIPLAELWGMSETCGAGTTNPPGRIKLGTVGPPVPGVEIRLAADGEIFIRGECVMAGYRNLPEKTAEVLDADGWLATGDVGEIDADGYLRIVDRKKELIINSAGKNMSPANIEGTLKGASSLIGQCCVIGDARPFNTALLVLDADFAPVWASQHGLGDRTLEELATEPAMVRAIEADVERANQRLARVEQVKKFHIVAGDWPAGGDELTPTMKLKRKPIAAKYATEIERMYGPRAADGSGD